MSQATDSNPQAASPPDAEEDALIALYDAGRLSEVIAGGEALVARFPQSPLLHDLLGRAHSGLGQFEPAARCFQNLLRISPGFAEGHHNLGVVLQTLGRLDDAMSCYRRTLRIDPDFDEAYHNLGTLLQRLGRLDEAAACYEQEVRIRPDHAGGHHAMGMALHGLQRLDEAAACYRRTLAIMPDFAAAHYNLGAVELLLDQRDAAIASFERALALKPDFAEAHYNLGNAQCDAECLELGIASYARALELQPDHVDAHHNMGVALQTLGRLDEAVQAYRAALGIRADFADVHYNLGNTLVSLDREEEAVACFQDAVKVRPDYAEAYYNLGNTLRRLGRTEEAIASYARALQIRSDFAEPYNNLGLALEQLGRMDDAITAYENALRVKPDSREASGNLGSVLQTIGRMDEAVAVYERGLRLNPGHAELHAQKLFQQAQMVDWDALAADAPQVPMLGLAGEAVTPFLMLPFDDNAARNRVRSERFAAAQSWPSPARIAAPATPATVGGAPERIRIGYFSADFHDHATMYLMARLFELHDRSRFAVHIFSYGPDPDDEMRRRLRANADAFHEVRLLSDSAVAQLARREGIDIAVDLKGYTFGTRLGIFARRPAPIQLSYLGYPGTLGTEFIDYIVADRVVIPPEQRQHFSENIVWLPDSYQVNDDRRAISYRVIGRGEMGLPRRGFVFCSFNNSYKIAPELFDVWMRLLQRVEGSVLWLFKANPWAQDNLRREAQKRGVDAGRLIFAKRVAQGEHLARHRLADLFLDTFNYNAHTSASDALWAGLPLITRAGQGFPARVAASLLTAVGLPELITTSTDEYERLALELATDAQRLSAIREKLASNRLTEPLFNTELFTRRIETAYQRLYDRYAAGEVPADIVVE